MTPEQFCYWLQGAFETMDEGRGLSQFDHTVRDHLKTVFHKVTPERTVYETTTPDIHDSGFNTFPKNPYKFIC